VYRACPLKDEEMVEFSKLPPSSKIISEVMTDSFIIPEVDAIVYVILSEAKIHMPYGELLDTTECKCYISAITQTEVIITKFNCTLPFLHQSITTSMYILHLLTCCLKRQLRDWR
jgi:hypothetical protein